MVLYQSKLRFLHRNTRNAGVSFDPSSAPQLMLLSMVQCFPCSSTFTIQHSLVLEEPGKKELINYVLVKQVCLVLTLTSFLTHFQTQMGTDYLKKRRKEKGKCSRYLIMLPRTHIFQATEYFTERRVEL